MAAEAMPRKTPTKSSAVETPCASDAAAMTSDSGSDCHGVSRGETESNSEREDGNDLVQHTHLPACRADTPSPLNANYQSTFVCRCGL
jgi:hypothetical protein